MLERIGGKRGLRPGSVIVARIGLLGILLTGGGCTPLDDAMAAIFGRSMRDQVSFDPYENPLPAPEGSVAFAAGNLPARWGEVNLGQPEAPLDLPEPFSQLDVLNQAPVVVGLTNAVPPTEESLARGEELFLRFCAPCHGPNAAGVTGYIIPAGYPPFPLVTDRVRGFTDGYIYGMIRVGRGLMPSYGHRISHYDRWNVVNYLRLLQGVVPASAQTVDDPTPAGTEGGQTDGASAPEGGAPSH